jgi:hypothetical protein
VGSIRLNSKSHVGCILFALFIQRAELLVLKDPDEKPLRTFFAEFRGSKTEENDWGVFD